MQLSQLAFTTSTSRDWRVKKENTSRDLESILDNLNTNFLIKVGSLQIPQLLGSIKKSNTSTCSKDLNNILLNGWRCKLVRALEAYLLTNFNH